MQNNIWCHLVFCAKESQNAHVDFLNKTLFFLIKNRGIISEKELKIGLTTLKASKQYTATLSYIQPH